MTKNHSKQEMAAAVEQYVSGLTILDVATLCGVNEKTVARWVADAGKTRQRGSSPSRRALHAKRTAALLDLASSGDSIAVVAMRQGVPYTTLVNWQNLERDLAYEGGWQVVGGIQRPVPREAS